MKTELLSFTYRIVPLSLPKVVRNGITYICTEKFRSNFNGDLGDIWLIYQTPPPEKHTWNLAIVSRKKINNANSNGLFGKFQESDYPTVKKYAFDPEFISRNGGRFSPELAFNVEGPPVDVLLSAPKKVELNLVSDYYLPIKNKKILSEIFGITGSRVEAFHEKNAGFEMLNKMQLNKPFGLGGKLLLDTDKFKTLKLAIDETREENRSSFVLK